MKLKLLLLTVIIASIINSKEYTEENILELIQQYLPVNPVVLEAGGHYGEDTVKMCKLWPQGTIYTFEPLPGSFSKLKNATRNCSNARCYALALSDKSEFRNFYISAHDAASSLLPPTNIIKDLPFFLFNKKPITVECINLDEWAKKYGVDHIDFMWLDMEGHELTVLRSAPAIVKTVQVIYTEVNFKEFRFGTPLYEEVKSWLEEQGFQQVYKRDVGPWENGIPWQANVLFVRNQ